MRLRRRCGNGTSSGMTAIKLGIDGPVAGRRHRRVHPSAGRPFRRVRDAVGPDVDIALDFHGRTSPAMATRLAQRLAPLAPMFIEEPCLPENLDALLQVARATEIPIATGERIFTKFGFREVIGKRAVAIVQPDLCHAGGISETRRIAAMAEADYIAVAPHNPSARSRWRPASRSTRHPQLPHPGVPQPGRRS